jgi:hypothetical protein
MTPTSTTRAAAGLLAAALVLVPLSACSISSNNVSCTAGSCSVTLSGEGAEADILGTTLSFSGTQDGRAELTVAGTTVACAEGESVTAGPLSLECTSVDADAVELTASLG